MMIDSLPSSSQLLFNSPLETGVRSLAILVAAYPKHYDLEWLVEMDYLIVHSGDANGPASLHPAVPMRMGELIVRRGLVERGLLLMASRNLIQKIPTKDGFDYIADDAAAPFMASLTSNYSLSLKERALWIVECFSNMTTLEVREITRQLFENWTSHFKTIEKVRDIDEQ